jgi:hypothetical protein
MIHDKTIGIARYQDALSAIPESGGGGCHAALLGIANLGVRAGLTPQQIFEDLRASVHGSRSVPDREIQDAINKAASDYTPSGRGGIGSPGIHRKPQPRADKHTLKTLCDLGRYHGHEADLWEASRIRIDWPPGEGASRLLEFLYEPDELLFIGERYGKTIRSAGEWIEHFKQGGEVPAHIIPNPLTGETGLTKDGKPSRRADSCVRSHRFAIVEFDSLSREDQIRFWAGAKLPVAALIDSGGKSIHGWVRVDCADAEEWEREIEEKLFGEMLTPLGVDSSCRNESRLSRLPGHLRGEKWQRILYLAPQGRPVNG